MTELTSIVVVGAGLAGGRAAEALRKEGFDGRLVLVGDEPHRPYERPPLSKDVLEGIADPDTTFLRDTPWYEERAIELVLGRRVDLLELEPPAVRLADGELIAFDACLLATGGAPRRLAVPGADLPGVFMLRTIDDAQRLRGALAQRPPVVIVGAGFIGLEVASTARALGCEVTVLEVLSRPLARALPEPVGNVLAAIHAASGVRLHMGRGVARIEGAGRAEAVIDNRGDVHTAGVVVVGVGIDPRDELARQAGLRCENGVVVDEHCRTSHPAVFAAGDVARHPNPILRTVLRVEHFQNAQNQGVAAARAMLGSAEPFAEVPWFWSTQYGHNLQVLGHAPPDAPLAVRGEMSAGGFTAFQFEDGRLTGAIALDRPRDIAVAKRLIAAGTSPDAALLADRDADLRALLSG